MNPRVTRNPAGLGLGHGIERNHTGMIAFIIVMAAIVMMMMMIILVVCPSCLRDNDDTEDHREKTNIDDKLDHGMLPEDRRHRQTLFQTGQKQRIRSGQS
jgi:uncharacterized membrane protein